MADYREVLRQHARIAILRFLEGAPRYTSNASMLAGLLPGVGIAYSRDQIETELLWLQDQGFVVVENHNGFVIAVATGRGVDIATGLSTHPHIQRPRPGS